MAKKTETKTPAATYEIGQDIVITCSPRSIHYRREYNDKILTIKHFRIHQSKGESYFRMNF